jgi:hypothetical protein
LDVYLTSPDATLIYDIRSLTGLEVTLRLTGLAALGYRVQRERGSEWWFPSAQALGLTAGPAGLRLRKRVRVGSDLPYFAALERQRDNRVMAHSFLAWCRLGYWQEQQWLREPLGLSMPMGTEASDSQSPSLQGTQDDARGKGGVIGEEDIGDMLGMLPSAAWK